MLNKNKKIAYGIILTVLILAFLLTSEHSALREILSAQEVYYRGEYTVTTYYPAPYGYYADLTTSGNTYLASDPTLEPMNGWPKYKVGIGTTASFAKLAVSAENIGPGKAIEVTQTSTGTGQSAVTGVWVDKVNSSNGQSARGIYIGEVTSYASNFLTDYFSTNYSITPVVAGLHISNKIDDTIIPGSPDGQAYSIYSESAENSYFAGRVGIGITNPEDMLHLYRTGNDTSGYTNAVIRFGENDYAYGRLGWSGDYGSSSPDYVFLNGSGPIGAGPGTPPAGYYSVVLQENGGRVGIGVSQPEAALQMGSSQDSTDSIYICGKNGGIYQGTGASYTAVMYSPGSNQWAVGFSGSINQLPGSPSQLDDPAVITAYQSRTVEIGTSGKQGTLDVWGPIYQRGGSLHADYVFEPHYKLESIEKHSDFMWKNKHLPALPKAEKEDDKYVVEIGQTQRGILEELEKAHIYIEQLNKLSKAQQKEIEGLKDEIRQLKKKN